MPLIMLDAGWCGQGADGQRWLVRCSPPSGRASSRRTYGPRGAATSASQSSHMGLPKLAAVTVAPADKATIRSAMATHVERMGMLGGALGWGECALLRLCDLLTGYLRSFGPCSPSPAAPAKAARTATGSPSTSPRCSFSDKG
ncbi:hypothetical protein ADL21_35855 [Streptomyces albus subsp. albus]|nr:hypothetical protein ADL21_35855 [Streptomyces albus subsp. albus]